MARILVTGVAGFIGSHTVDLLLAEGHVVAGIDSLRTGKLNNLTAARQNAAFTFQLGDLTEAGRLAALVESFRPEAIIHLAALVSVQKSIANPALNQRLNFDATKLVCAAARAETGVRRIVFASSAAVYGARQDLPLAETSPCKPLSPYGAAKLDSEALLLECAQTRYDIVVRCHRYFNVYGPRQDPASPYSGVISRFADAIAQKQAPIIFGDGEQTRDFISVFDVARANVIAATEPEVQNGVANICTGRAITLNQLLATFCRLRGATVAAHYHPARDGDIRYSCGSPFRAGRDLQFTASVDLNAGLATLG